MEDASGLLAVVDANWAFARKDRVWWTKWKRVREERGGGTSGSGKEDRAWCAEWERAERPVYPWERGGETSGASEDSAPLEAKGSSE